MGNTLAAVNITGNELCNTLHSVPTTEHSATLNCSRTGRYSTLQKTDPGLWDLNEFSAEIGTVTTTSEEQGTGKIVGYLLILADKLPGRLYGTIFPKFKH